MSLILPTYLVISELLVFYNCAPKLGHPLFDPLMFETKLLSRYSDDFIGTNGRREDVADVADVEIKAPCKGYNFDDTKCKKVDNRVLCGYNKNIGDVKPTGEVDMGNGCRLRGDRIECGYVNGPFNSVRRPPANREPIFSEEKHDPIRVPKVPLSHKFNKNINIEEITPSDDVDVEYLSEESFNKLIKLSSTMTTSTSSTLINLIKSTLLTTTNTAQTMKPTMENIKVKLKYKINNTTTTNSSTYNTSPSTTIISSTESAIPITSETITTSNLIKEIFETTTTATTTEKALTPANPQLLSVAESTKTSSPTMSITSSNQEKITETTEIDVDVIETTTDKQTSTRKATRRCVEIRNRIVCYDQRRRG